MGAYVDLYGQAGLEKLQLLVASAATMPVTRLWLAFVTPSMTYVPGSNTLCTSGLNMSSAGDCGFAELQTAVKAIVASGVDVLLSVGGWDGNCLCVRGWWACAGRAWRLGRAGRVRGVRG